MALYAPASAGAGTLMADRGAAKSPRRRAPVAVARAQSPDQDETDRRGTRADRDEIVVPHPSRLRIPDPLNAPAADSPRPASNTTRRIAWQPRPIERAQPTDLNLDPAADHDAFSSFPADAQAGKDASAGTGAASRSIPSTTSGSRWHRVKTEPLNDETAKRGQEP